MKRIITLTALLVFSIPAFKTYAGDGAPGFFREKSSNSDIKMLSSFLFVSNGNIADGNRVVFAAQYSNGYDANDAPKLMNPGENFGLIRDNHVLAIEARQPIAGGDTLFYYLTNLHPQVYRLEIVPDNLASTMTTCELVDRYLNIRTNINLADSNHLRLEVTSDPASRATDRLIIVFKNPPVTVLPVEFTGLTASRVDKGIVLQWQVKHELDVQQYGIERGTDAEHFTAIATVSTIYDSDNGGAYLYNDMIMPATDEFYRIHAIDRNGISTYSDKIKVSAPVIPSTGIMAIFPNPVPGNSFQVQLNGLLPGRYFITIANNFGQQTQTTTAHVNGSHFTQTIGLEARIGKGVYNVSVWNEGGIVRALKLVVE